MTDAIEPSYWVFSNHAEGTYEKTVWDMSTILRAHRYSLKQSEKNLSRVRPGDVIYMRIYGQSYIGKFVVGGPWTALAKKEQGTPGKTIGFFPMDAVEIWPRPLPQNLILGDLSNQNFRARIVKITHDDDVRLRAAVEVYRRLGFGGEDVQVIALEKGLEEAVKASLKKLGLRLADEKVRQQFSMGVGVGRSDLICLDDGGDLVILELKRGLASDEAVGQVLRYVGWAQENLATEGQKVHGWIVAGDFDEHLRLAAKAARVKLVLIRIG